MKHIVIIIVLSVFSGCVATKPLPSDLTTYEKIFSLPNQSKDQLYIKTNEWFVRTFVSSESIIEFQDKDAGKILGKYVNDFTKGIYNYRVKQVISIDIKEGKVRLIINEPLIKATGSVLSTEPYNFPYKKIKSLSQLELIKTHWQKLASDLENTLIKDTSW